MVPKNCPQKLLGYEQMTRYTTANLAKIFCVTSQTVRNAAKELNIEPSKDEEGKSFIFTQEQAEILAARFKCKLKVEEPKPDSSAIESNRIQELKEEIERLRKEIATKDELLKTLTNSIDRLTVTNEALSKTNALKEANEKKELFLVQETQEKNKKSLFKRIFGL